MRQLLLLRHAEAEPSRVGLPDIERALSARGRAEALDAAQCILDAGLMIDAVIASPAVRTRETAIIVAAQLDIVDGFIYESALYLGAPEALLPPVQRCEPKDGTVLLVGHNPGLSELAALCMSGAQHIELRTGGLCRIEFEEMSWQQVWPGAATSVNLLR